MKAPFLRPSILLVLLTFGMFVLGVAFHKYRFFPYELIKSATLEVTRPHVDADKVFSREYSRDVNKVAMERYIDTALLPLKVKGVRISEHYAVPKNGGAITAIGNTVIVLDRLGNIYSYNARGDNVKKLSLPNLPNNIADYLQYDVINDKRFRAYSIRYLDLTKQLAVSHEYFDKRYNKSRLVVSVIGIDEQSLQPKGSWEIVFQGDVEPTGPNEEGGGALAAHGPNKIYLSVGEYQLNDVVGPGDVNIKQLVSQDVNSKMGKIFEINVSTHQVKMVSLGHRNPEGLIVTTNGDLLSTEHGPNGGDELNLIVEGANYGWPIVTLGTEYGNYSWPTNKVVGKHTDYKSPMFAWVPSVAVSSLLQVQGFDPRWDSDLLVASLKGQTLYRLRVEESRVLYSEPIWIGQRLRDIAQMQDGTIVLWTDDTELQFISVDREKLDQDKRFLSSTSSTLVGYCMFCHHFGPTGPADFAPSLTNVLGRKIASDNFRYSAALRTKDEVWTEKFLHDFIANPDEFATGTAMPNMHLDQDQLNDVLSDLKKHTATPVNRHGGG